MAENTAIEWCHHTFSPWEGCQKVGPGCDHCYAEARDIRFTGGAHWGPHAPRRRTSPNNWRLPLKWDRAAAKAGRRDRVFSPSLADPFDNHPSITDDTRRDWAAMILSTPHLDWMLLTKRIGNALRYLAIMFPNGIPPNVWIGATIVNQEEADRDIPKLLEVPAKVRFLSMEPLLGPVDLTGIRCGMWTANALTGLCGQGAPVTLDTIHLVICGGESGPKARPMHPDWARSLRDQCVAAGVAFHFKQWGEWGPRRQAVAGDLLDARKSLIVRPDGGITSGLMAYGADAWVTDKVGKARAGRLLDGRTWDQMPGEVAA